MPNERPYLLFCLAGSALVLAVTLTYPFNNDNALYAYMADLAMHGNFPYVGSWDQNFPGIIPIQMLGILLFGHSQVGFHLFDIILQLCSVFFLYKVASKLGGPRAGCLAGLLFSFYYIQGGLWMAGERDTYASLLLFAALFFLIVKEKKFWSGVLISSTIVLRPTYGLLPLALAGYVWFEAVTDNNRKKYITRYLLGVLTPIALSVIALICTGALRQFWLATIVFNFTVYGGQGDSFPFWEPVRFYWPHLIALFYALYLLRDRRPLQLLFVGSLAAALVSLIVLYRHSIYHYHPVMSIVILLSAVGWSAIIEKISASRAKMARRSVAISGSIILLSYFLFAAFRGNTSKMVLADLAHGKLHHIEDCYTYYEGDSTFGEPVQRAVGEYLKAHTMAGQPVQMFGPYSYPQFDARLSTASRFQTIHALVMRHGDEPLKDFQLAWRTEYLMTLTQQRPKYFIVCDAPKAFRQYYGGRLGHEILREDFRELGSWVSANYVQDTIIGAFTLYRNKE